PLAGASINPAKEVRMTAPALSPAGGLTPGAAPADPGSVGIVTPQLIRFDEPLQLASGQSLQSYELAVDPYVVLTAERPNALRISQPLNASHHVAGVAADDPKETGGWDKKVGPGKPGDTNRFSVIGVNNLGAFFGSTGPASITPA